MIQRLMNYLDKISIIVTIVFKIKKNKKKILQRNFLRLQLREESNNKNQKIDNQYLKSLYLKP